jgi:O-succinylbenzoate synthase
MRIQRVEMRRIDLPYVSPFETSGWREEGSHAIVMRIQADGIDGWGEAPVRPLPWYNEETSTTVMAMVNEILAPMLMRQDITDPTDVQRIFAPVRANRMAQAALRICRLRIGLGVPANKALSKCWVAYVSASVWASASASKKTLILYSRWWQAILITATNGLNSKLSQAGISSLLRGAICLPHIMLQVDANSIYTLDHAEHLAQLDEFGLLLIEQPLATTISSTMPSCSAPCKPPFVSTKALCRLNMPVGRLNCAPVV